MSPRDETIPAKPEVLRWAREYARLSLKEAAQKLSISRTELSHLEDPQSQIEPTLGVLRQMSEVYEQPDSILLLPKPPATQALPTDFRSAIKAKPLTQDTVMVIRHAQETQRFVSEILEDEPELLPHTSYGTAKRSADPEETARRERQRLGIESNIPYVWPLKEAFARWRRRLEANGFLVLVEKIDWAECRGFSLHNQGLIPTIVLNSRDVDAAKTFTLFHEYAHILRREAGICERDESSSARGRVERWCNRFAAAFLVPREQLETFIGESYPSAGRNYEWPVDQLRRVATKFRVSRAAMALRLEETNLAAKGYFERNKAALFPSDRVPTREVPEGKELKIKHPQGWKERSKVQQLGVSASSIILEACKSQLTDAADASRALGLTLEELPEFERRVEAERARNVG